MNELSPLEKCQDLNSDHTKPISAVLTVSRYALWGTFSGKDISNGWY